MNIRPFDFSEADYQAFAAVREAAHPEAPLDMAQMKHLDRTRGQSDIMERFLLEQAGQVVGVLEYATPYYDPRPGALEVRYHLRPEAQALEAPLWEFLLAQLAPHQPRELQAQVRENWPEFRFLLTQGFAEVERRWESVLDLQHFDAHPFIRPLPPGIALRPLGELPWQEVAFQQALYELEIELLGDVPSREPITPWPFEVWRERTLQDPNLLPEGYFLALEGPKMVGVTMLFRSNRPQTLRTGLTGVRASHRRQGIAWALKLRAIEFARSYGVRYIRTSNHQINRPMLAINEALGFVKEPAAVFLRLSPVPQRPG
ncbi:GNAT family N-acetyltransferase [Meiothermus hypogaeus]|uniref:GCN5 family acetyltransferase n=2 Tax=Meiothermus hypogaeus TaxID=884155 RepID=A0A511QXF7_9DEIN|nr:GNAT family N-acetyltransferase [Meiothermus hypogaeus]RIH80666.1 Acetyltransferase (GNAT) family protein [Meiothermus hypogaeus]GEM82063.1 GCN5 family acetyltransferase [Meiothermus hypogaeus NBRC 106114]